MARFEITKRFTFEAAHKLPNHDGKCKRLHGHSWRGELCIGARTPAHSGAKAGMVMDYGDLKAVMTPILDRFLDHHYLNETLAMENPTSEAIARWLCGLVQERLQGLLEHTRNVRVVRVSIEETCTSRCDFFPEKG